MEKQNFSFINKRCKLCGGADCADIALSRLRLTCAFDSKFSGEAFDLRICGKCADNIISLIKKERM